MSPDPLGGHTEDPQTLNRYSYVRNNPATLTDPTGLDFNLTCTENDSDRECENGVRGTRDRNGNFTATVIRNDRDGNLVDQNGNRYNAKVTAAGVVFGLAWQRSIVDRCFYQWFQCDDDSRLGRFGQFYVQFHI